MSKIDEIINRIYDPKIENPEYQTLMASCIKAWLRDAVDSGIQLGREDFAIEIDKTVKKYMNPNAHIVILGKEIDL